MKCKRDGCDNEAIGRGVYCSGTCKTVYNRNKKRNTVTKEVLRLDPSLIGKIKLQYEIPNFGLSGRENES